MGTLARDLARDLLPLFRSAPFALFGHSMGSWIALELARELQRTHRPAPAHLFLSARRAPTVAGTLPPLYHLPDAALIQGIQERYDAIPAQLLAQPELMALFLPGIRADFTLIDTHVHTPGPKLRAPIDAYTGADDPHTSRTDLEPYRELTTGPVRIRTLPGGHFFLRDSRDLLTSAIGGALRPHL
jgi:surfactin synthase thioesterase subunit